MNTPSTILNEALEAPSKSDLEEHLKTIRTLRRKKYTLREIAEFLTERGVQTDHSKIARFLQKYPEQVIPCADDYYNALKSLDAKQKIGVSAREMIWYHFDAPNCTVNYTQLAYAAAEAKGTPLTGSSPHSVANSVYGTLGHTLGDALGMDFLPYANMDKPLYSSAIGAFLNKDDFVMHHELVKALARLRAEGSFGASEQSFKKTNESNLMESS